jgi:hypothetical protein
MPGNWSAHQCDGFAGRRGHGAGGSEGQAMDVSTRAGRDHRLYEVVNLVIMSPATNSSETTIFRSASFFTMHCIS